MLKNYVKIAWRNLVRNKTYSLLILSGLATGMTCAIASWLYVNDELSFDRYHRHADRIYRLNLHIKWSENEYKLGMASAPFGPALKREYPEIENTLRVKKGAQLFKVGNKSLNVKDLICADSTLFKFFDYHFIEGNAESAFKDGNSVVLTEKLAMNLFGKAKGVTGRIVTVKDNIPFVVSGIVKEIPANHHLKFDAILPYTNVEVSRVRLDKWDGFNTLTYILLNNNEAASKLESKLPAFYKKYIAEQIGDTGENKVKFAISLQALTDIHLHSSHLMGEENGSNMSYVYTFSIIGLFILLIAIVNYVNLATARSTGRAKEIGIRKAVGSQWSQLVAQFLSESLLVVFLALLISTVLLHVLLPFFNEIAGKSLSIEFFDFKTLALFSAFALLTGVISGLYPAFMLSRFRPALVLKGMPLKSSSGTVFRRSLVVFQFFISMVMIIGTITVYRQLIFMRNSQLGFNQELVIKIPLQSPLLARNANTLKEKLLRNPQISNATLTNGSIGDQLNNKTTFSFYKNGVEKSVSAEYFDVDTDFTGVLQINIADGRNFSAQLDSDSSHAILVNQAMLKRLGWNNYREGLVEVDAEKVAITGVISDFHLRSLHNQIEPLVLVLKTGKADNLLVKVSGTNLSETIDDIKGTFGEVNADQPFEYDFLDQAFARQYRSDEQKGRLFLAFSVIAIIIACLGLFGLATFMAEQRRKEIGIRKVLGASIASIVSLLSIDFLKLVMVATLIAIPAGLYLMQIWLQNFAYKITLDWWIFVLSGSLSILIAIITVSFQSIKAALTNPVDSMHSE
ncbi:ABC transporter permease [Dyadobacter sp. CY261]|uniref:ABC transporter permease n=1 Tax=Dyadobacter sp. CY261 TaxID=2907203 RepID=UPI001F1919BA|nr:ABC transporter permease [Dyadobacter sp. CY261]MCF0069326.1 ABC transporter permease [Dyadobacter sp. CY261]